VRRGLAIFSAFLTLAHTVSAEPVQTEFNDAAFDWYSFDEGLARAKAEDKAVFALVKADWCPVCQEYQQAFIDGRVIDYADDFVFVILDVDAEGDLTASFAPDGNYVPRTMIFSADGKLQTQLAPYPDEQFNYFISTPDELAGYLGWVVSQPELLN
jgi:protein-disulfide reductase (glutathione)